MPEEKARPPDEPAGGPMPYLDRDLDEAPDRLPPELLRPPALPSVEPAFDRLPPLPFASVRPAFERDEAELARDEPPDFARDELDFARVELDFARVEPDFARVEPDFVPDEPEPERERDDEPEPDDDARERDDDDPERDDEERLRDEDDPDRDDELRERDPPELLLDELRELLEERRLDDRRRVPPLRSAAGISSRATAFASCSICFSRNFAIRSSSRRMLRASFAVSLSPTVSASDSMPA